MARIIEASNLMDIQPRHLCRTQIAYNVAEISELLYVLLREKWPFFTPNLLS